MLFIDLSSLEPCVGGGSIEADGLCRLNNAGKSLRGVGRRSVLAKIIEYIFLIAWLGCILLWREVARCLLPRPVPYVKSNRMFWRVTTFTPLSPIEVCPCQLCRARNNIRVSAIRYSGHGGWSRRRLVMSTGLCHAEQLIFLDRLHSVVSTLFTCELYAAFYHSRATGCDGQRGVHT